MTKYNYVISKRVHDSIYSFYTNVAKKYKHTYSIELMYKNTNNTYNGIYKIENRCFKIKTNIKQMEQMLYG